MNELIKKYNERIIKVLELAISKYNLDDLRKVNVRYDLKGHCAGQAIRRNGNLILRFNKEAIEKDFDVMLNDTIPHEVAHLVCFLNPSLGRNHDRGWKRVCMSLGGSSDRTHSIELTPAKKRTIYRYEYALKNGKVIYVTKGNHEKIRKGMYMLLKSSGEQVKSEDFVQKIAIK